MDIKLELGFGEKYGKAIKDKPNDYGFEHDTLKNIIWGDVEVMWNNDSYVHGITHITWTDQE